MEKPNFERINYSLRPAKHVERKMFCETFGRLSAIDKLRNYRYIGMGSAYFSDFTLFHKTLGITKLLSIEGEKDYKKRIYFNKPFSCINVKFGDTFEVLPTLPWDSWKNKSIVWLDYTEKLMEYMLGDTDIVTFNIKPGSIFLISVNIERFEQERENVSENELSDKKFRLKMLEQNVGKKYIPQRAYNMNLNVDNNKLIIREIINNTILSSIKKRNDSVYYKQLFNLYYKDSADMLTVGGIIYNEKQTDKVNTIFENLDFICTDESCFDIIVPKLTYREILALDKVLPNSEIFKTGIAKNGKIKIPLSKNDVKNYVNIYRYFPNFTEINL